MAKDRAQLLSGRIKTKRGSELDPRRIDYLSLDNAEPNLGNPDSDLYVVASLADGNRVFLKFNQGFTVSADSVSGNETTFEIDPSGLVNATGTTLAEVLDDLDSAISEAFLSGVYHDSNFNGAGTIDDVLSLDSNLNIFSVNVSDTADINQATVATLDVTDSATIADLSVDSNANLTHVFVSDLTDNRITIAGTNGQLEDDANLTFNGTQFDIGTGNFTVQQSTGNTAIAGTLNVTDSSTFSTVNITQANVTTLDVTDSATIADATVTGTAIINQATVTTLDVIDSATIADVNVTGTAVINQATVTTLDVTDSATIVDATVTGTATINQATVTTLDVTDSATINQATVTTLDVTDSATINQATVTTLDVTDSATIVDANVTGTAVINQATVTTLDVSDSATIADANVTGTATINQATVTTLDVTDSATINQATVTTLDVSDSATIVDANVTGTAVINQANITTLDVTDSATIADATVTGTATINQASITTLDVSDSATIVDLTVDSDANLTHVYVSDLTDNRIVISGASGKLEDDANFTFNGTQFDIGGGNFTVQQASGNTQIVGTLDVDAQTTLASANVQDLTNDRLVVAGTNGELEDDANLTYDGSTLTVSNSTASTSSASGALVVTGGVGIGGALNVDGNTEINGNLTITGTTTTVDVQTLSITDPLIHLADSNETSDEVDIGFIGHYYDAGLGGKQHTGLFRDATDDKYYLFAQYQDSALDSSPRANVIDINDSSFVLADINVKEVFADKLSGTVLSIDADSIFTHRLTVDSVVDFSGATVDIDAGTIDGTTIGDSNPAAGTFTDLARTSPTGVTAGTYGSVTAIPVIDVDSSGFIDSIATVAISTALNLRSDSTDSGSVSLLDSELSIISGVDITTSVSGTTYTITHDTSGVTAGTYGSASQIPIFTVDSQGHIDSATSVAVSDTLRLLSDSTDSGTVSLLDSELTIAGGIDITTSVSGTTYTITHDASGVTAGTYGSASQIPIFTVDSQGHVDSAGQVLVSDTLRLLSDSTDSGSVSLLDSELTISGGTDITTSVSGTAYTITHDASGVTAGTYGSASQIPIFTVDSQGHVDSAGQVLVSDTLRLLSDSTDSGSVSLLDSELTISGGIDITTSVSGTAYTITHDLSGVTAGTYGSASQIPILVIDSQGHVDSATTVAISDTLRLISDSDSGSVSLLDSSMSINEGEGINIGLAGTVFTVSGEDATVTNKGIASFDSTDFVVTGGAVSLATDITIDSNLQVNTLTVTDSATIADLYATTLTVTDSATIADLDVTTLTIVDSVTIGGNLTFVDSDDLIMPDNSRIILGGNNLFDIYYNGSVGIISAGTSTSGLFVRANTLELVNTANNNYLKGVSGGSVSLYYNDFQKFATTNTGIDVTGEVVADSGTISGNFTVDSGTLYVDATNNHVGIGTTSPATALDVRGDIRTGPSDAQYGQLTATTLALQIGHRNGANNGILQLGKFPAGGGFTEHMRIDAAGNVGIGTTSPAATLHVAGEAQIDSDLTLGGNVFIGDNQKINIGEFNDLQIYHDGQHSYIVDSGSGQLRLRSSAAMVFQNFDGSKGYATFTDGADVKLYYNGGEKFATTATGVQIKSNALIDSNLTIGGYLRGPSNLIIDPADYDSVTGTVTILGNLQVDGTTTTINSTTLTVDDKNIIIASGSTNATASDSAGITIDLGSNGEATILYKSVDDEFKFNKGVDIAGTLTVDSIYSVDISIGQLNDVDLTAGNGLVDEYLLKYNAATGNFEMEQEATLAVAISGHAVPLSLLDSVGRAGTKLAGPLGVGSPVYYDSDIGLWTGAYRNDSDVASHVIITYNSTDNEFNIASSGVFTLDSNGSSHTLDTNSYYYLGDSSGIATPNNPNSGILQSLYYAVDSNKVDLNIAEAITLDIGTTDLEQYPNISAGQTVLNLAKTINTAQTDLFKNGVLLREGASYDYVINSSTQITLNDSLDDSDLVNVRSNVNTAGTGIAATSLETFTVTDTNTTVIAYFSATASNAAKFVVSANDGTDTEITELLIAHDGTTAVATEYGQVSTGSSLATYNVTLVGTNVNLTATLPTAISTNFKIFKTLL